MRVPRTLLVASMSLALFAARALDLSLLWSTWPPRRRWVWAVGRLMPWVLIAASLVAAGGNLLALTWPVWRGTWAILVAGPVQQAALLLAVTLVTGWAWTVAEYDLYRHAPHEGDDPDAGAAMKDRMRS